MHEQFYRESIVLELPAETGRNGVIRYAEYPVRAIVLESAEGFDSAGRVRNKTVFLVKSDTPPVPGGRLRRNGITAEIGMVKTRRNFDDSVEGYYCVALY